MQATRQLVRNMQRLFTVQRMGICNLIRGSAFKTLPKQSYQFNLQFNSFATLAYKIRYNFAYPPHKKVAMPSLSPTMELGSIQKWNFKEGDFLKPGDVLCEVETDKSTVGFEVQDEYYLAKILMPEGTKNLKIGATIAISVRNKADIDAFKDYKLDVGSAAAAPAPAKPVQQAESQAQTVQQPAQQQTSDACSATGRVFASPLAKKAASEKGVNLNQVKGSGPGGRIIKQDVDTFTPVASQPETKVSKVVAPPKSAFVDIELTNMRKTIAKRLLESKQTIPHFYLNINIEMDEILKARELINKEGKVKISVNDLIIKACSFALRDVPDANVQWLGDKIRKFNTSDISVAVATDSGLITPIVFGAEKLTLTEISGKMKELAKKARENKLQPAEFQGGSFTISNLGMFGIDSFSAIINPPQGCILAVSRTSKQYLVNEANPEKPRVANVMSVCLSCDHRAVDGAIGANFLARVKHYLEKPYTMLL